MDPQLDEPDLRSYLGTISRRKWLVAAVTFVFFGVAVAMSVLAEPKYELRLLIQTQFGFTDSVSDSDRLAEVELGILGSAALTGEVQRVYNGPLPISEIAKVRARDTGTDDRRTSNLVQISLVTSEPEEGRQLLRVYAETYVERANTQTMAGAQRYIAVYYEDIAAIDREIAEVEAPIVELDEQISAAVEAGDRDRAADLREEQRGLREARQVELDGLRRHRGDLQRQARDLERDVRTGLSMEATSLGLVQGATHPVSPNIPRNLAIGLVFGLFLGVAAAFIRDYFDDSVTSKDVVERVTGVPALGLIPRFDTAESELVAAAVPNAPATESFRSLRTSVKFMGVDREVRIVQVTSPSAGEGKTVTAANLATVLAQAGDRVVLVGADLRRPRVEELTGVALVPGLTEVLIGEVPLPQAVRSVEGVPNLSVLPSGQPPTNPSELLSGERARRLIEVLSQTYDIVVLDCPPILPVTDSLVLARMADTTLLVTSARRTSRRELERAVEVLSQMDVNLAGTVVTSLDPDEAYSEPYGYDTVLPSRAVPKQPMVVGPPGPPAPTGGVPEVWQPHPEGMPDPQPWPPETPQRN